MKKRRTFEEADARDSTIESVTADILVSKKKARRKGRSRKEAATDQPQIAEPTIVADGEIVGDEKQSSARDSVESINAEILVSKKKARRKGRSLKEAAAQIAEPAIVEELNAEAEIEEKIDEKASSVENNTELVTPGNFSYFNSV